jgi:hypothetical protein
MRRSGKPMKTLSFMVVKTVDRSPVAKTQHWRREGYGTTRQPETRRRRCGSIANPRVAGTPRLPEGVAVPPSAGWPGEVLEHRRSSPRVDHQ